jgi:hypothetical protein
MFSSHGTEEEENDYTNDEERRRQLREDVLEGLKIGDDEGEGGADDNAVDKNMTGSPTVPSVSLTDRLPTFSPRKNQAFRNTFGFIAPGGSVPTLPRPLSLRIHVCRQPKLKLHCRKAPNCFCFLYV